MSSEVFVEDGVHTVLELGVEESFPECRACLKNYEQGFSLAGMIQVTPQSLLSLQDIMTELCAVQVEAGDGLPLVICEECRLGMVSAYKLRLTAQSSDAVLRERLETSAAEGENYRIHFVHDDSVEIEALTESSPTYTIEEQEADEKEVLIYNDDGYPEEGEEEQMEEDTTTYICDVCGSEFQTEVHLDKHKAVHVPDPQKPFQCKICYQRFHLEVNLKLHKKAHTTAQVQEADATESVIQIYQCQQCKKEFKDKSVFEAHLRLHRKRSRFGGGNFKCEGCDRVFGRLNVLARHTKSSHPELEPHQCDICGLQFPQKNLLAEHMTRHENVELHVCGTCDRVFRQASALYEHLKIHSSPYLCAECGKIFPNNSNLRQHLLRHTGEKPFACDQCPSRFVCRGSLKTHIATHMGLRPYKCDLCDSRFTKPYSLKKHLRIHTGERPYVCESCGMRFNASDHVKRHMRIHTGEKPYKCKFCDRAFAQSNDLVKHTRSHVGSNTYQCPDCPEAFRLLNELKSHAQKHFLESQKGIEAKTEIEIS